MSGQTSGRRFSELLAAGSREGPQTVTRRGVETAVVVPIDERRKTEKKAQPGLKDLLLAPEARTEALTPLRVRGLHRATPAFE